MAKKIKPSDRNRKLFDNDQLDDLKCYIRNTIEAHRDASEEYREEIVRWNAAYNCVYREEDHTAKTQTKLFDPETHDAIDTVSKRINVAIFSNDKISKLEFDDYKDAQMQLQVQSMWDKIMTKMNLRKIFEPILKSLVIDGTCVLAVTPNYKETSEFVTSYDENGEMVREQIIVVDSLPKIEYINILDMYVDPTIPNIADQELIARKVLMDNDEFLDEEKYMTDVIRDYDVIKRDNMLFEKQRQSQSTVYNGDDTHKIDFYDLSGIDTEFLTTVNKRLVYHVFFKKSDEEGVEHSYFAIVDAATFEIYRVEYNIYDYGQTGYIASQYLVRPGCFYGIGAAEQAGALQTIINELANQELDNINIVNNMNFLCRSGTVKPNNSVVFEKMKFINVDNPDSIKPVTIPQLGDIENKIDKLREQIQKKTKATQLMQGLPMEGSRTATEMIGIREEQNLSIKDIIDSVASNTLEPALNLFKDCLVQFYEEEAMLIKIAIDDLNAKFQMAEISFDEVRATLGSAYVNVVSVQEQTERAMEINELKNLLAMALQRPDILNVNSIMKTLYFDKLKFKDFDKMLTNTVMTGTPVPIERETQILSSGTPINTSEGDNHEEHIKAHTQQLNATVQAGQRDQNLAGNESMQRLFGKILFNLQNHIGEHTALYNKQRQDEQAAAMAAQQQGAMNGQAAGV